MDMRSCSNLLVQVFLYLYFTVDISGQTYSIQTVAGGGGLPLNLSNWDVGSVAVDLKGKLFIALGFRG